MYIYINIANACRVCIRNICSRQHSEANSFSDPSFLKLTDERVDALWFFFPMDAQEVDGYAGEHDDQTDATNHGLRVETETQQQRPEHQVADRNQQVHLQVT